MMMAGRHRLKVARQQAMREFDALAHRDELRANCARLLRAEPPIPIEPLR